MKKWFLAILAVIYLFGCGNESALLNDVIMLRNSLLSSTACEFTASITVDYGEAFYTFSAKCRSNSENNMTITVIEPESIAGINGEISSETGKLTFDDQVLAFEMIGNGQITPISVPWLLMEALRGGYISMCSLEDRGTFVRIDDSYKDAEFSVDMWLDNNRLPTSAEIIWEGKRIVSMRINDFVFV